MTMTMTGSKWNKRFVVKVLFLVFFLPNLSSNTPLQMICFLTNVNYHNLREEVRTSNFTLSKIT
jgi:hypothetical protein